MQNMMKKLNHSMMIESSMLCRVVKNTKYMTKKDGEFEKNLRANSEKQC